MDITRKVDLEEGQTSLTDATDLERVGLVRNIYVTTAAPRRHSSSDHDHAIQQHAAIFTSQQSAMLCFTRDKPIRLPDTDEDDLLDDIYSLSLDEKLNLPPDAPSEDEMQQRLKDLRKEISANKLDW